MFNDLIIRSFTLLIISRSFKVQVCAASWLQFPFPLFGFDVVESVISSLTFPIFKVKIDWQ